LRPAEGVVRHLRTASSKTVRTTAVASRVDTTIVVSRYTLTLVAVAFMDVAVRSETRDVGSTS